MEDINLEPITTVLWLAEDHKPTEGGIEGRPCKPSLLWHLQISARVCVIQQTLTINSVAGALQDKTTALANLRDYEYQRTRRENTGPRPRDQEERYQQRRLVLSADGVICVLRGCSRVLLAEKRHFRRATNLWVCGTCRWRPDQNNDELRPVLMPKATRTEEEKAAADLEDDTYSTSQCVYKMRDGNGKLNRRWRVTLRTHVCDLCRKLPDKDLHETRPTKDKCTKCKSNLALKWNAKNHQWLCQTCTSGHPPKPDPPVCQTNWCLREGKDVVRQSRKDSQTWVCNGCEKYELADVTDVRPPRSQCYGCGLDEVARGKCKIIFKEEQRQWFCKDCGEAQ